MITIKIKIMRKKKDRVLVNISLHRIHMIPVDTGKYFGY
jgi:hypothetical protein